MRVALGILILAGGVLGTGLPLGADECCKQGKAEPWKKYNAGVKWRAALSKDPARWAGLAQAAVNGDLSLAAREKVVTSTLKQGEADGWKKGMAPAIDAARKENKLLMFFQLVGDLDLEGC
jgi:hypothetical protein